MITGRISPTAAKRSGAKLDQQEICESGWMWLGWAGPLYNIFQKNGTASFPAPAKPAERIQLGPPKNIPEGERAGMLGMDDTEMDGRGQLSELSSTGGSQKITRPSKSFQPQMIHDRLAL